MEPIQHNLLATRLLHRYRDRGRRTCQALRRVVRAEIDVIACFTAARARLEDAVLADTLARMQADQERHVLELSAIVRLLGDRPPRLRPDLRGRVMRRWTALSAKRSQSALLAALRAQVRRLDRRYERALAWDLPLEAGANLIANQADLRTQREQLRTAQELVAS